MSKLFAARDPSVDAVNASIGIHGTADAEETGLRVLMDAPRLCVGVHVFSASMRPSSAAEFDWKVLEVWE